MTKTVEKKNIAELEISKAEHINYIIEVAKELKLNIPDMGAYRDYLSGQSVELVYKVSAEVEATYEAHLEGQRMDQLFREINELGVKAVKEKYGITSE